MTPLSARLHYLELGSEDPARLADWYRNALGMTVEKDGQSFICRGRERCILISPGASKTLVSAGYALSNSDRLDEMKDSLSRNQVAAEKTAPLFSRSVSFRDPDGNRFAYGLNSGTA